MVINGSFCTPDAWDFQDSTQVTTAIMRYKRRLPSRPRRVQVEATQAELAFLRQPQTGAPVQQAVETCAP